MAAWFIEGDSAAGRILGKVMIPGREKDHSPCRSELVGILSTMMVANKLHEFYNITDGAIELACDGLSAIDKAFFACFCAMD